MPANHLSCGLITDQSQMVSTEGYVEGEQNVLHPTLLGSKTWCFQHRPHASCSDEASCVVVLDQRKQEKTSAAD